jgi:hypothetical protein
LVKIVLAKLLPCEPLWHDVLKEIKKRERKKESSGTRWFLYVGPFILITSSHFVDQPSLSISLSISLSFCPSLSFFSPLLNILLLFSQFCIYSFSPHHSYSVFPRLHLSPSQLHVSRSAVITSRHYISTKYLFFPCTVRNTVMVRTVSLV